MVSEINSRIVFVGQATDDTKKLRFKFRTELIIASRTPNKLIKFPLGCYYCLGRDEMTKRILSRQTVKFTKMTEIDLE